MIDNAQLKADRIDAKGPKLANKLEQKHIAKECTDEIRCKVRIRTITADPVILPAA